MFLKPDSHSTRRPNDELEHSLLTAWLETSDMGLCVVDSAGLNITLNAAACQLLGIDGLSALNQPVQVALANLDNAADLYTQIAKIGQDGEAHLSRSNATDGTLQLLVKFRAITASSGEHFKMVSITNITSVIAAQQMEEQRRQWQAINAGVVISDARQPDMPVVYVNPMFEAMSGYSSAEMLGRNCRHLQGPEKDQPALQAIRDAIRNQSNGYAVLRNYRKDGSVFLNELFISPIKDAQGTVTHFMGIQHLRSDSVSVAG
jgi:PAS domain S-box-containing protein